MHKHRMVETSSRVWYSVYATLPEVALVQPYMDWLEREHMPDVLRLGKALRSEIHLVEAQGQAMVEGRYEFPDHAALEQYVKVHAPALRAEGMRLFPKNSYVRYVSFLKASVLPSSSTDKKQTYETLEKQVATAIAPNAPWESKLVSLIALLKSQLDYVSWVGFYRAVGQELWVGPYQGPLACDHIPFGKGVCGHVAEKQITTVVEDVEKFPGHIACDSLSRSEIVLPVFYQGKLAGVLDLDSYRVAAFDRTDAFYLEKLLSILKT